MAHGAALPCTVVLSVRAGLCDARAPSDCDDQGTSTEEARHDCQGGLQPAKVADRRLTVGPLAALIFGVIVQAGGDRIPGVITVVASLIGLVTQIPIIATLCRGAAPSPPHI